jgi:hypothetical protein
MVLLLLPLKSETSTHFIVGIPSIYEVTSTGIGRLTGRSFCLDRYSRIRLLSMSFPHGILDCLTISLDEIPELLGRRQRDQVA